METRMQPLLLIRERCIKMEKFLFSEEQKLKRWRIWLVSIVPFLTVLGPIGYGIYSQEVLNKPFGNNSQSSTGLILTALFLVLFTGLIVLLVTNMKLKTKINHEGIWVAFPPMMRKWKIISPEEIENYEVRTFRAREFGGHGIKRRWRNGKALTISGNTGLQLYLKDGKKILIGTQKKQAIEYAMNKMMNGESLN